MRSAISPALGHPNQEAIQRVANVIWQDSREVGLTSYAKIEHIFFHRLGSPTSAVHASST